LAQPTAQNGILAQPTAQNGTYQPASPSNSTGVQVLVNEIKPNTVVSQFAQAFAKGGSVVNAASASQNGLKAIVTASILDRDKGTTVVRSEDVGVVVNILQKVSEEEMTAGHSVLLVCPIHGNWVHFDLFID